MKNLVTLDEFKSHLSGALKSAAQRVVVYSPIIDFGVVVTGGLCNQVASACARGVSVVVLTDNAANRNNEGKVYGFAKSARDKLQEAGAFVRVATPVEYSLVITDNSSIAGCKGVNLLGDLTNRDLHVKVLSGVEASLKIEKERSKLRTMSFLNGTTTLSQQKVNPYTTEDYGDPLRFHDTYTDACGRMCSGAPPQNLMDLAVADLFAGYPGADD